MVTAPASRCSVIPFHAEEQSTFGSHVLCRVILGLSLVMVFVYSRFFSLVAGSLHVLPKELSRAAGMTLTPPRFLSLLST